MYFFISRRRGKFDFKCGEIQGVHWYVCPVMGKVFSPVTNNANKCGSQELQKAVLNESDCRSLYSTVVHSSKTLGYHTEAFPPVLILNTFTLEMLGLTLMLPKYVLCL